MVLPGIFALQGGEDVKSRVVRAVRVSQHSRSPHMPESIADILRHSERKRAFPMADISAAERRRARRVFEETLATMQRQYAPMEDVMLEARIPDGTGQLVVVARYKLYTDGRIECFEIMDEILWPHV